MRDMTTTTVPPTGPIFFVIGCTGICIAVFGLLVIDGAHWTWWDLALIYIGGTLCTWGALLCGFTLYVLWGQRQRTRKP